MLLTGVNQRYFNTDDVRLRLLGTIVRYKGLPVYVHDVESGLNLEVENWEDKFQGRVNSNDDDLDISSPELGYIHLKSGDAVYPLRQPDRSQRQGIDPRHLGYFYPKKYNTIGISVNAHEIDQLQRSIRGSKYPKLGEVLDRMKSPGSSVKSGAFSRNFAVTKTHDPSVSILFNKIHPVGYMITSDKVILLTPDCLSKQTRFQLMSELSKAGAHYEIQDIRQPNVD